MFIKIDDIIINPYNITSIEKQNENTYRVYLNIVDNIHINRYTSNHAGNYKEEIRKYDYKYIDINKDVYNKLLDYTFFQKIIV